MRNITTLSIILLVSILANELRGQSTEQIKNDLSFHEYELFEVTMDSTRQKNGMYQLFDDDKLVQSGYYRNDEKDSLWIEYNRFGKKVIEGSYSNGLKNGEWTNYNSREKMIASGLFENDARIGQWNFYKNEKLVQQFDFEKNKLIVIDSTICKKAKRIFGGIYDGLIFVDQDATFKSKGQNITKHLEQNIKYPVEARTNKIRGRVTVRAIVNEKGEISDFKVLRGIGSGCDQEFIRVLKSTSGQWTPAMFNNQAVPVRTMEAILFM